MLKQISLLLLFICATFFAFSQTNYQVKDQANTQEAPLNYSRAKVLTTDEGLVTISNLGIAVDHGVRKQNTHFISDFSSEEIALMRENGFVVEILIEDVKAFYVDRNKNPNNTLKNAGCSQTTGSTSDNFTPVVPANFNLGSMGGFLTYAEFIAELDDMVAQYPNLITAKAPIDTYTTIEGRPIYYVRLSDNPNTDEAEPEVLYSAIHHAREPNALSEVIFYMWYLLENYGTDQEITFLVDNTEMYFVPLLNPDGYVYNETTDPNGGGMHRKNRRNVGTTNKGVDLNRNYSYGWNTTGVSSNMNNDTYPGASAFSEAETQAMKWFCENRDFQFAFNAHTYGNLLLFPVGTTTAEIAEDNDYMQIFTDYMVKYNNFFNQKSSGLYPASGDSDDYMYKEDIVIKPKIIAMTPEVGGDGDGFWPAAADITSISQSMVFTNMMLSHMTHKYMIVDDADPSSVANLSGNFNHDVLRIGMEDGPVTVKIVPLTNIMNVGAPIVYNIDTMVTQSGAISFNLNPSIQFGDEIKYILETDYGTGNWVYRDTVTKTFGNLTLQVMDDASNNTNWTGTWNTTTAEFVSPSSSFTDSPSGNYANSQTKTYTFNQSIDLTNATAANVNFYAKWAIEPEYDYVQFQVSTNNGSTWTGQCGNYTNAGVSGNGGVQPNNQPIYDGNQNSWIFEEIGLSDYLGQTVQMRFILKSDGGVNDDGFYFDDFTVNFNESTTSGLGELDKNQIKVFPNPANETVVISLDKELTLGKIVVFDQTGKTVLTQEINAIANKWNLNTSNLPSGTYFIKITNDNLSVAPQKLIIAR